MFFKTNAFSFLYFKEPQYFQMRSFGCLCYRTIPKSHRTKFDPRTTPHVFVGYLFGTKGYRVLSLASNKIYVSRDVTFHETIFPFSMNQSSSSMVDGHVHGFDNIILTNVLSNNTQCSTESNNDNMQSDPGHADTIVPTELLPPFSPPSPDHIPSVRKSTRISKTPAYINNYLCNIPHSTSLVPPHSLHASFSNHHHIASKLLYPDRSLLY